MTEHIDNPAYVKAIAHPLRLRILAMLAERPTSPARLAAALGVRTNVAAYHVKRLRELGLAKLVREARGRGGVEHFYAVDRPSSFTDEAWAALAPDDRSRLLTLMLRQINEYVMRAAVSGGFERPEVHISRSPVRVDEAGWRALAEAAMDCFGAAAEIERAVEERESDARFEAGLVILLFEATPFSDGPVRPPQRG